MLLTDGRISFAEIGRRVGLSLPAVSERVKRLEEAGIIEGYRAQLNFKKLGFPIVVFVELTTSPDRYDLVKRRLSEMPEVIEAHHVAGDMSFLLKLRLADLEELEPILAELNRGGQTSSTIVLSTTIDNSGIGLLGEGEE